MSKKTHLILISIVLLFTLSFTGCGFIFGKDDEESLTDEVSDRLTIVAPGGGSEFTIVHSTLGDKELTSAINVLQARLEIKFSASIKSVSHVANGEKGTVQNDNFEILIGQTNRKESVEALESLAYGEYVIRVVGNKLVITGTTPDAIIEALNIFMEK